MHSVNHIKHEQDVWIIFTGKTDLAILKLLKKDFRHCFLVMRSPDGWLTIDPLYLLTDITFYQDIKSQVFLPNWFLENGYTVFKTYIRNPEFQFMIPGFCSCVEIIKKIIGLNNYFIFTPWQLYKYLKKKG